MYSNVYGVKHVNSIITSQWFMVWKSFRPGAWLQCPGACLKLYAIQCFSRPSILSIIWRRSPYPPYPPYPLRISVRVGNGEDLQNGKIKYF